MKPNLWFMLLLASCDTAVTPSDVAPNPHRDAARAALELHCGSCHREDSPTADPAALVVYNLNDLLWPSKMKSEHVADLVVQFEDRAMADAALLPDVPTVKRFVETELALRCKRNPLECT
ncbi:MAG: hypothetical protein ACAI38_22940 [Myxococcota bacterium]|nr:hypothetical protein [Myxococcota bacterium]